MRVSLRSLAWMPTVHTPEEDLAFIGEHVLPRQRVIVAEADSGIVGFIAVSGEWVEQLYLHPAWTGWGIGSRLLGQITSGMATVKLHCFQANEGARHFYERHGFQAEAFSDGASTDERLPDITYVRRYVPDP